MSSKIGWGVIGAGGIADRRTIPEGIGKAANARLVAVMDANRERAKATGEKYNVPWTVSEKELLANPDVDAVYVATPNYLHARQAIAAMKTGRHVMVEKPLALTLRDAERMLEQADKSRVKLACGYMMRFHGAHKAIAELVRKGRIGKPVFGRAQLTCWYPPIPGAWRQNPRLSGGGSFMDMGSHCLDLLEMFFGRVRRVNAFTGRLVQKYRAEDTAVASFEFDSGAVGVVDSQFNVPDTSALNRLELYGSAGSILAEGTIGQASGGKVRLLLQKGAAGYAAKQLRAGASGATLAYAKGNTYQAEVEDFSNAILRKREPLVTAEEALWNLRVCLAVYQAARTGRSVKV